MALPKLQLATVPADNDALIKAIEQDPLGADDGSSFDLHEDIDAARIEAFLNEALADMTPEERKAAQDSD